MLRSLLLALVMVSALLVLLAGASGGLRSLPNPSAMLSAMVTTVTANSAGPSRGESQSAAVVPSASAQRSAPDLAAGQQAAAPASQPPPGALERQVSDLQAQLKERSQELDSVRASQEQVRRDVGTLLQQQPGGHAGAAVAIATTSGRGRTDRPGCGFAERRRIAPHCAGAAATRGRPDATALDGGNALTSAIAATADKHSTGSRSIATGAARSAFAASAA